MKDRAFVDSNIWLYLLGNDADKKEKAISLLQNRHIISTQVLAENSNVCRKKFNLDIEITTQHIQNLASLCEVALIIPEYIVSALKIAGKYQLGFYDSLIIATAIDKDCQILYSEDLQDGQLFESKLKVINPFK
ncbi:MAG: PIN domain-containing protein [Bacteroidetes bacterium]|nr:PIN domain-containing protein [Bacteroidota bacterium]